ncbi:MAG: helix-turn-helix domain-containing protein [Verrucomicrobiota bacterium]
MSDEETGQAFQEAFFERCPAARSFFDLFEYHPTAYFHAKDERHRYVAVNHLILRDVFALDSPESLFGRTDLEYQAPALASAYHAEDRRVMEARTTLPNKVWLVPHVRGVPKWYVSTKTPMVDHRDEVVGTAGVMYPIDTPKERQAYFRELSTVVSYMEKHYAETISMAEMAEMVGLSSTRFNLRFRQILHMSPSEFQLRLRVERAQKLLTMSERSLAEIALDLGFCDQSHFGKRFQKVTGLSPRAYRKRFR